MPQEDDDAPEFKESEKVRSLAFPSDDESSKVLKPSEETFHFPSALVPLESTAVLVSTRVGFLRCDELNATLFDELGLVLLAVPCPVADEIRGELVDEGFVECLLGQGDVVSRTIRDANGDRKTIAVCNRHDLCRLSGTTLSDFRSPFLAFT